ncbi:MAG: hypothetical protein AAF225_04455 [Pseudomonadota bacterium]
MNAHQLSDVTLPELGNGTGLVLFGFRAAVFGQADCHCVQSGFTSALGADAAGALEDILTFARLLGHEGTRKIGLSAPGHGRMTRDEVSLACVFSAAQAWDQVALEAHLSWLVGAPVPPRLVKIVTKIADSFAGHGLAFHAPRQARCVPAGNTPAFRIVN